MLVIESYFNQSPGIFLYDSCLHLAIYWYLFQ